MRSTCSRSALLSVLLSLGACGAPHARTAAPARAQSALAGLPMGGGSQIVLDGDVSEWAEGSVLAADDQYLYFRFSVGARTMTLQHSPEPVVLMIDADADTRTGKVIEDEPDLRGMGVDLAIVFSGKDGRGQGCSVEILKPDGQVTKVSPYDAGVVVCPTVASRWYEGRISRNAPALRELPAPGLRSMGALKASAALMDASGAIAACSDPATIKLPPAGTARALAAEIPAKPEGAVRIVSWNVEKSSPVHNPKPFARVIQALAPDAVLVQEWTEGTTTDARAWFVEHVGASQDWNVVKASGDLATGGGVAIVSRFPLEMRISSPPMGGGKGTAVRFVGAVAQSPLGPMLLGSTHLKCCGFAGSPEDQRRLAEAEGINAAVRGVEAPPLRLICGDMNLVGSRAPLDALARGLDADGSDLAPAPTRVLGDRVLVTWGKSDEAFAPGRLDYALVSDASLRVVDAFVLDTRRLSDESLARLGLERTDCDASDHMPVVVDVVPADR